MATVFDVVIVGSGAAGGTLAAPGEARRATRDRGRRALPFDYRVAAEAESALSGIGRWGGTPKGMACHSSRSMAVSGVA
jgi:choline dehydrogenase-like flavoprotein